MIEVSSVTKFYKRLCAVDNVSFSINKGESFALLGPNGAGKTTIIRMLMGFSFPNKGTISINGISSLKSDSRKNVGYLAEKHKIPQYLTGEDYLRHNLSFVDLSKDEINKEIDRVLNIVDMKGKEKQRVSKYSKGMVQRIGLAASILGNPKYLILDEPTSGLDPLGIMEFRNILEDLNNSGTTIFLSSHNLSEIEKCCHKVGIINSGCLCRCDNIDDIIGDDESLEDVFVKILRGENG